MNPNYEILEYQKILEMLKKYVSNSITRELVDHVSPIADLVDARRELEKTGDAMRLSARFGTPPFYEFQDKRLSLRRAKAGASLSIKDLLEIAGVLRQIRALRDWYDRCEGVESSLDDYFDRLTPVPFLLEKLERSILSEEEIADAASPALADIRRKLRRAQQKLRDTLDSICKRPDVQEYLQEERVTIREGRFVLPVKVEHRSKIPGLVHDTSASGQTLFIEPLSVVDAGNDIRLLELQEAEEIQRILTELCAECGTWSDVLITDTDLAAELNLYFAKSRLAEHMHAFIPTLTDDGVLSLQNARHPLIPFEQAVPISFTLGASYKVLIITGPNTGGKTVSLKTCGLLTLMAMSGMPIPASENSRVSVFSNVLADIGDTQSIEQNLSTFSAHMRRVIEILDKADDKSLVLLDEIGSGTDPVEGAALAEAIIDRLKEKGARLMVSTHYQELKIYATECDDVENASCAFDIKTLKPTYHLQLGSPGKSNAFAITAGLGMESGIIQKAQNLISRENLRFEQAVERLEDARHALESERETLQENLQQSEKNVKELKQALARTETERAQILEQAQRTAMQVVESTKAQSNAMLTELEALRRQKERDSFSADVLRARSDVKKGFREMYSTVDPLTLIPDAEYHLPRPLRAGDHVVLAGTGQKGVVAAAPDRNGVVFVQMGAMRTRVPLEQLRLVQQEKAGKQKPNLRKTGQVSAKASRRGSMELDIRGRTCDEGVYEMESFLDHAILSHIGTVTIIHGKGTGLLRKAVHDRLKQLKFVKSYRLGTFGEGEDGVTIVELQ